jgi:hypothetical protein
MGTNYYWHRADTNKCECCGRSDKYSPVHIGASFAGWCFMLHVSKGEQFPPSSFEDWKDLFYWDSSHIEDEYGNHVSAEDMIREIENRSCTYSRDKFNYTLNDAEPGPGNLVRCKVNGWHCIGHGEGTWDYIVGDFS